MSFNPTTVVRTLRTLYPDTDPVTAHEIALEVASRWQRLALTAPRSAHVDIVCDVLRSAGLPTDDADAIADRAVGR